MLDDGGILQSTINGKNTFWEFKLFNKDIVIKINIITNFPQHSFYKDLNTIPEFLNQTIHTTEIYFITF